MSRGFLATGPALLLLSCAVAFAHDGGAAPSSMPSADFLLSMGPYGALVWGAYLLGKGVKEARSEIAHPKFAEPLRLHDLGRTGENSKATKSPVSRPVAIRSR